MENKKADPELVKQTILALKDNGFEVESFENKEAAADWISQQMVEDEIVAFGGSMTLQAMGLKEKLIACGVDFLDYRQPDLRPEDSHDMKRQCFFADSYFLSANAITADGTIFNVDATGNRVAALTFGPDKVYIIAGTNKICRNLDEAHQRVEQIAGPKNCVRLNKKTPCVTTRVCMDCESEDRICRVYSVLRRPTTNMKVTVVLIEEVLGY